MRCSWCGVWFRINFMQQCSSLHNLPESVSHAFFVTKFIPFRRLCYLPIRHRSVKHRSVSEGYEHLKSCVCYVRCYIDEELQVHYLDRNHKADFHTEQNPLDTTITSFMFILQLLDHRNHLLQGLLLLELGMKSREHGKKQWLIFLETATKNSVTALYSKISIHIVNEVCAAVYMIEN